MNAGTTTTTKISDISGTSYAPSRLTIALARLANVITPAAIEAWACGDEPLSDYEARYIEQRLGLPTGWMDEPGATG
jgi:hypothetical protein